MCAKCSICGTIKDEDFHQNSLIGYNIAKSLWDQGDRSSDYDYSKWKCLRCYRRLLEENDDEDEFY